MAAAGFGNLISDIVGISLGEVIEAGVARVLSAPPLSYEQLQLRTTRLVKGSANAIGISIGCLLGMAPLLLMHDRKAVFFDDDELDVYHTSFAPYGVSPQQFFDLLHHGKWRTVEEGTTLVKQGDVLNTTIFLHAGESVSAPLDPGSRAGSRRSCWLPLPLLLAASAACCLRCWLPLLLLTALINPTHAPGSCLGTTSDHPDGVSGKKTVTAVYEGRSDPQEYQGDPSHNLTRGCIIGGSALVDPHLSGVQYPNTVRIKAEVAVS